MALSLSALRGIHSSISCWALQLDAVGACLYCVHIYMLIPFEGSLAPHGQLLHHPLRLGVFLEISLGDVYF